MIAIEMRTRVREFMQRTSVTYYQLAAGAGVSPTTVRYLLRCGDDSEEQRGVAHGKLVAFLNANAGATKRSEVRFT